MLNFFKNFGKDEDGAVTVDFVVLTAAIVLLGLAVGAALSTSVSGVATTLVDEIDSVTFTQPTIGSGDGS